MTSNDAKNEMLVRVLTDLAEICKKLAEDPAVPENLRAEASDYGEAFDSLLPYRGRGMETEHSQGQQLLVAIARFLPKLLEVDARPRVG